MGPLCYRPCFLSMIAPTPRPAPAPITPPTIAPLPFLSLTIAPVTAPAPAPITAPLALALQPFYSFSVAGCSATTVAGWLLPFTYTVRVLGALLAL